MRVFFLDDKTRRVNHFREHYQAEATIARSAPEAVRLLTGAWDLVMLDHDLLDEPHVPDDQRVGNNGVAVVRHIISVELKIKKVVVHSTNVNAARYMRDELRAAGYDVCRRPFEEWGWIELLPASEKGGQTNPCAF
jgi:hypothetical protein